MKRSLSFERAIWLESNGIGRFMAATSAGLLDVGLDLAWEACRSNLTFGIDSLKIATGGFGAVEGVGINAIETVSFDG